MLLRCFHAKDISRQWPSYLSRSPSSRAEFDSATEFIVGHFTSSIFLRSILSQGLIPDMVKERAVDDNVPSDDRSIYLTTIFDRYYMQRAIQYHGGTPICIELRVSRAMLKADEARLSSAVLATCSEDEALYLSMRGGACKHVGPIPVTAIISVCDAEGTQL